MPVQVLRALPAVDMSMLTEGKNTREASGMLWGVWSKDQDTQTQDFLYVTPLMQVYLPCPPDSVAITVPLSPAPWPEGRESLWADILAGK